MAELLTALLASPSSIPDLLSTSPPNGISDEVWALRHELPLHLINFLRDQANQLLVASQSAVPSPTKNSAGRPAKYQYNSPLKAVSESPGIVGNKKLELGKKSKKKVKLFSINPETAQRSQKGQVEESWEKIGADGLNMFTSPACNVFNGTGSSKKDQQNASGCSDSNEEKRAGGKMAKRISAKFTPSPQSFSLSDFLTPTESKRGNKKGKSGRSPSKMKASTPIEEAKSSERLQKTKKVSNIRERLAEIDLDDKDSFPDISKSETNKKRRIKPIMVSQPPDKENCQNPNSLFGKVLERTDFSESPFKVEEVERNTVNDRDMIKESITRQTPLKVPSISPTKPSPIVTRSNSMISHSSVVSPLLVTSHQKPALILLGSLYSQVLLNNLMPNLVVELYFLLELLLLEVAGELESAEAQESYLASVHNCVFFSSFVLSQILCLLAPLDGTTLRLLADNSRLSEFCPNISEKLLEMQQERLISPSKPTTSGRMLQNVSFQSETDNRSNFPSSASFHDFKKQRDKFYSLIRRWGEESRSPEYEFVQLSAEVDLVMTMLDHPINHAHFARLFRQQLVAMCRGEMDGNGAPNEQVMSDLRRTDPLKYKRLAARLTTPGRSGGPCPSPTFTGAAEFCRDFILACKSHKFIQHLKDSLIVEIQRLDALPLEVGQDNTWGSGMSKLEDSSGKLEVGELAEQYQENLLTLRILAKFLGFLEALPYSTEEPLTEEFAEGALAVRSGHIPLKLAQHLRDAECLGRLALTLPWTVEFLAQLDQVTYALPHYKSVLLQLVVYYQHLPLSPILPNTSSLLSLLLGWLFEGPFFPRELLILARIQPPPQTPQDSATLDSAEVVSWQLVAQCCPWLAELRGLLQHWEGSRRNGSQLSLDRVDCGVKNYRKITPVAAPAERMPAEEKGVALQVALEKNFFHNQPSALRRSVDFLAERLASNVIRKVRTVLVLQERQTAILALQQQLESKTTNTERLPALQSIVPTLAQSSVEKVKNSEDLFEDLQENCNTGLQILLSSEASEPVRETCVAIVKRLVREKVDQYLAQHVTYAYFSREYTCEAERLCRRSVKEPVGHQASSSPVHNTSVSPPSCSLVQMKLHLRQMLVQRNDPNLSETDLLAVISDVEDCLSSRVDLTPTATRGLETLSVDWFLAIITFHPGLITDTVVDSAIKLWHSLVPPQLVSILCPRNLLLLGQSSDDQTWKTYSYLLESLIKAGLLPRLALTDSRDALRDRHPNLLAKVEKLLPCDSLIPSNDLGSSAPNIITH